MSIEDEKIQLTMREAAGAVLLVLSLMSALGLWIVLPHRTTALEESHKDHETRIRAVEVVRVDLAEIKTELRGINKKLDEKDAQGF